MTNFDYQGPAQPPEPRKRHRVRNTVLAILGAFVLLIIILIATAPSAPKPSHPAAGTPAATQSSAPAQPAAPSSAAPVATQSAVPVMGRKFAGTGNWNSAPFTLSGAPLTVTYSFSGNIMPGELQGDNFIADVVSPGAIQLGDDQQIVNTIATSGGATTTLYPDITRSGTSYHLSVTATGSWSFTITEAGNPS